MWVFCCGMRRSGSTLQYQLAARIVEEEGIGKRIEWVRPEDFPIIKEKYKDYKGLKIFKSHIYTPEIGAEFKNQNAVGVYIYRDIRDAFLSQKSKSKVNFSVMWVQNFLNSAIKNYYAWTSQPGMHVSKYEEVVDNLPLEVQRIATHLGITYEESKCNKIAEEYSLERQKERIGIATSDANLQHHKEATFDPNELLHANHISSGKVERWKREMLPWQTKLIENKTGDWLIKNGYSLNNADLGMFDWARAWSLQIAANLVKIFYYRNNVR